MKKFLETSWSGKEERKRVLANMWLREKVMKKLL
jgi:hypothetical protein